MPGRQLVTANSKNFKIGIDICIYMCYNTIVPKGSQEATGADGRVDYTIKWSKKVLKKIKIPLDKLKNL